MADWQEPGDGRESGVGPEGGKANALNEALRYAQVGTMIVAPMILLGGLGYWLDRRFGTKPWIFLGGLLLGMLGGFVSFFQLVFPPKGRRTGGGTP